MTDNTQKIIVNIEVEYTVDDLPEIPHAINHLRGWGKINKATMKFQSTEEVDISTW